MVDAIDDILRLVARHSEVERPVLVEVVLCGIPHVGATAVDLSALDVTPILCDRVANENQTRIWMRRCQWFRVVKLLLPRTESAAPARQPGKGSVIGIRPQDGSVGLGPRTTR